MEKFQPETIERILTSFYVDDVKSVIDEQQAIKLANELMNIMKLGGFRLTKFLSNKEEVIKALPTSEVSKSTENRARALGMNWSLKNDLFQFSSVKRSTDFYTKREVLKVIASVFNPLGLLSPFTVSGKSFLQELWKAKGRLG